MDGWGDVPALGITRATRMHGACRWTRGVTTRQKLLPRVDPGRIYHSGIEQARRIAPRPTGLGQGRLRCPMLAAGQGPEPVGIAQLAIPGSKGRGELAVIPPFPGVAP